MSCCSSITDVLKNIIKAIAPIVAIALVCFAVYAIFLAGPGALALLQGVTWLPAGLVAMEASTVGYLALGAALLVSPETVTEIATTVAKTVGSVAGTVLAGVTGGLVSGLFGGASGTTILGYAALAALAYYFLVKRKDDKPEVPIIAQNTRAQPYDGRQQSDPTPSNQADATVSKYVSPDTSIVTPDYSLLSSTNARGLKTS